MSKNILPSALLLVLGLSLASCGQNLTSTATGSAASNTVAIQPDGTVAAGSAAPDFVSTGSGKISTQGLQWVRVANHGQNFIVTTAGGEQGFIGKDQYGYRNYGWFGAGTNVCDVSFTNDLTNGCFLQKSTNTFAKESVVLQNGWTTNWSSAYQQAVNRLSLSNQGSPSWGGAGQNIVFGIGYTPTDAEYNEALNYVVSAKGWDKNQYNVLLDSNYRKVVFAMAYIYRLKSTDGQTNNGTPMGLRFRPYDTTGTY